MLVVTYDIKDDKLRTQFSRLLKKYGYRLQYSVFTIKNSDRIMRIIIDEIRHKFEKNFSNSDSIIIFRFSMSSIDKMLKFGFAKNMDDDIVFL